MSEKNEKLAKAAALAGIIVAFLSTATLSVNGIYAAAAVDIKLKEHLEQSKCLNITERLPRLEANYSEIKDWMERLTTRLDRIEDKVDRIAERSKQ